MATNDGNAPVTIPPMEVGAGRGLMVAGFLLTAAYLVAVGTYAVSNASKFASLDPNNLGDFLGGAFAPLAFLWLVLGFLQQGYELRNSANALWLQGQELQNSVEQQRELVNVTREQLQFESHMLEQQREEIARNSQPVLSLRQGGNMGGAEGARIHDFHVINHGKPCTAVSVFKGDAETAIAVAHSLPAGGKMDFRVSLPIAGFDPFAVRVDYLDERLMAGTKLFTVSGGSPRLQIVEANGEGSKEGLR